MSQVDAEKRVDFVVNEAKTAGDNTRRNAAHLSFWITAALLFGALSASFAAPNEILCIGAKCNHGPCGL